MSNKKTHEQYENELFELEADAFPIEPYRGAKISIVHECSKGHSWLGRPDLILAGSGCPHCYGNAPKTLEEHQKELEHRFILPLSYTSHREYATYFCGVCEHEWSAKPRDILADHGCPKCAHNNHPGGYNTTRFSRDRELADSPGVLYCVVLVNRKTQNRDCVKIGITKGSSSKDVIKRAAGFKGYELRTQKLVKGTLEEVFNMEQTLHKIWSSYKYTESHRFGGYTELFQIDKLSDILKSIRDLEVALKN